MVEHIVELDNGSDEQQDHYTNESDDDELSVHHQVPHILRDLDWNDVTEIIHRMDAGPMSEHARQLAQLHKHMILSKRREVAEDKQVVRASYKGYSFYTYPASEFERKSAKYLQEHRATYTLVQKLDPTNPEVSQQCVAVIVGRVETTLRDLLGSQLITDRHYILMHPHRSTVQMNYLYFVPDTHQVGDYFISIRIKAMLL